VKEITTSTEGVVNAEIQNVDSRVDKKLVTLTPYTDAALTTAAVNADFVTGTQKAIIGWKCTSSADAKFMPASCR
jgi:hypothetical protein